MKNPEKYESQSLKLSKAIDLAISAIKKFPPRDWTKENLNQFITVYSKAKEDALNPETKFKNLRSLKYIENDVFIYFQEATGEAVEYFWKEVKNYNLDYARVDKLSKILKRGKIKSKSDYDYVTDVFTAAFQENRITQVEFAQLSAIIGEFENGKNNS